MWFLLGIFDFLWRLWMVICGENVVKCVVNVEKKPTLFRGCKIGHLFQLYFQAWSNREQTLARSG
jgi:hypothetical protein